MANYKNNDTAISPIVATLVLIVVAVIGAVAVGTILGTFSSDVSKQANANGASSAAQTEILVAGSTTIDPITQAAANATSGLGILDLRSAYDPMSTGINASAYVAGANFVTRADGSGTADSFYQKYLGLSATSTSFNATASPSIIGVAVNGNAAVVSAVASTKYAVGFADYGDSVANVLGPNTITILPVMDAAGNTYSLKAFDTVGGAGTTANFNTLRSEAKYVYQGTVEGQSGLTDPAKYPTTLLRPLFYVTNGVPSS